MKVISTEEFDVVNVERYVTLMRYCSMVLQVFRPFHAVVNQLNAVYEEVKFRPERGQPLASEWSIYFSLDTSGYGAISGSSLDKHLEIALEIYDHHVFKDDIAEVVTALGLKEGEYVFFAVYRAIPSRTEGHGQFLERQANAAAEKVKTEMPKQKKVKASQK
jgi:hypothetical protein